MDHKLDMKQQFHIITKKGNTFWNMQTGLLPMGHVMHCIILFSMGMNSAKQNLPQFKKDATQVDRVQRKIKKKNY